MTWDYTLRTGAELRDAIHREDLRDIILALRKGHEELHSVGLIDEWELDTYTEDFEMYLDDTDDLNDETVNYELGNFYDLCDSLRVWIPT